MLSELNKEVPTTSRSAPASRRRPALATWMPPSTCSRQLTLAADDLPFQLRHPFQGSGYELLAAITGENAHQKNIIDGVQKRQHPLQGGIGIEGQAGTAVPVADHLEQAGRIRGGGFHMKGNPFHAGLDKMRDRFGRIVDHQVGIKGKGNFSLSARASAGPKEMVSTK